MRIKEITRRNRRDFTAIYKCEHCGYEYEGAGYDDAHFHNNVIPERECSKCGKKAIDYVPRAPKYAPGERV